MRDVTLEPHPAAGLMPAMTADEYAEMRDDMAENGLLTPIVLHDGKILDGRHRYQACRELGIEPRFEVYDGDNPVAYVVGTNLHRRHLSASQRAAVAVEILPMLEEAARERQAEAGHRYGERHPKQELPELIPEALAGDSREQAAALTGANSRYISDAKRIAEQAPDVLEAVKAGSLDLPLAKRVAALPAEARPDVLTQVVAATAKGTRAGRREAEQTVTQAARPPRLAVVPAQLDTLGPFQLILADPPWRYEWPAEPTRRVENHYPTMDLDEIKALGVPAADDAVLFLWANSALLPEAIDVMGAWGFSYRTCAVWTKNQLGMGYYFRQQHELLLLGMRGHLPAPAPADRPSSLISAPRGEHSVKPVEAYEVIERMYPDLSRLELFARQARPGWVAWGNEIAAAS